MACLREPSRPIAEHRGSSTIINVRVMIVDEVGERSGARPDTRPRPRGRRRLTDRRWSRGERARLRGIPGRARAVPPEARRFQSFARDDEPRTSRPASVRYVAKSHASHGRTSPRDQTRHSAPSALSGAFLRRFHIPQDQEDRLREFSFRSTRDIRYLLIILHVSYCYSLSSLT
ncbi:hypothetical protein PUN28_009251 [Cardiocondyla obscurior]|uniref:Uncharacterized protein n=1 Tax=Cardiocondyla obscurior TaxID=286306 RepID=A0AAW2FTJ1_9HYME